MIRALEAGFIESIAKEVLTLKSLVLSNQRDQSATRHWMVYTFFNTGLKKIAAEFNACFIEVDILKSKHQYEERVKDFFSESNPSQVLFISCNSYSCSDIRVNLCRSIVNSVRST